MEHLKPEGLFDSERFGFTQVVTSPPGKLVFLSGQTAIAENGQVAGGDDLKAQAHQAFTNVGLALEAAGAGPKDVTHLRLYIVNADASAMGAVAEPLQAFLKGAPPPAQTLIGVQALALPDLRIEIEAVAVVS